MREVPASEFARNFGMYREIVQRETVAVTSHGRATGYFVSAAEFAELQRFKQQARKSFATIDLSREEAEAVAASRMRPEHDHLNALLENQ
jgi:prevent-host-death family protein